MKQNIIILLLCACTSLCAQEITGDTLLSMPVDSLSADSLSADSLSTDTFLAFDEALGWLDTTNCTADSIILSLPDSVYKARLQALPFIIEVPYNVVVRDFIARYLKHPQRIAALRTKAQYYFPMFEDAFGKAGLPYELKYLAVIESALNPTAHSHAGAAGLWQFMPSTGKIYGLEINSLVDERMDPVKSTQAACRFLTSLYNIFGDWNLAIAAYNCGPGNVNKAIHRSGKRDFWSIYPFLPRETRSYLPIYIAASYVMNYADDHGICPANPEHTILTDTIMTTERLHLKQVSSVINIPIEEMRHLNPQYGKDIVPGGNKAYAVCLPMDKTGLFIDQHDSIMAYKADSLINNRRAEIDMMQKTSVSGGYSANGWTYYKIKSGDTLSGIAHKFHCSVKQLKAWNGLKSDNIRAGKTLKIGR